VTNAEQRLGELFQATAPASDGVHYDDVIRRAHGDRRRLALSALASTLAVGTALVILVVFITANSGGSDALKVSPLATPAQQGPTPSSTAGCSAEPPKLSAASVQAGRSLNVTGPSSNCGTVLAGTTYSIVLGQVGRAAPVTLAIVNVQKDGSFMADVTIPTDASPGESYILIQTSTKEPTCHDVHNQSESCAGLVARITVLPPALSTSP
jgi:hypothetical protein